MVFSVESRSVLSVCSYVPVTDQQPFSKCRGGRGGGGIFDIF